MGFQTSAKKRLGSRRVKRSSRRFNRRYLRRRFHRLMLGLAEINTMGTPGRVLWICSLISLRVRMTCPGRLPSARSLSPSYMKTCSGRYAKIRGSRKNNRSVAWEPPNPVLRICLLGNRPCRSAHMRMLELPVKTRAGLAGSQRLSTPFLISATSLSNRKGSCPCSPCQKQIPNKTDRMPLWRNFRNPMGLPAWWFWVFNRGVFAVREQDVPLSFPPKLGIFG